MALVGPAGSGKSHHALVVARDWNAGAVIDDGLLIAGNRILAGQSAKREKTLVAATLRATFADPVHARQVREALARCGCQRVLVLGTSRHMVETICQRLGLPYPQRWLHISEVASRDEIRMARRIRRLEGKHVIPAPTFEVEKSFPRHLLAPLRLIYRRRQPPVPLDKTVVRPTRTELGRLSISEEVVRTLARRLLEECPPVARVNRVEVQALADGVAIRAEVTVRLAADLLGLLVRARDYARQRLEHWTGLSVVSFAVTAVHVAKGASPAGSGQLRPVSGWQGRP